MSKKTTKTSVSEAPAPELTQEQITRAALNLPGDEFVLGTRTFKLKDLGYDDYLEFVGYLSPLIETAVGQIARKQGFGIPGLGVSSQMFSTQAILGVLGKQLPDMVQIMCRQTDHDISVDEVKHLAKKPTVLVAAVVKQIHQNDIIKDFTDFFAQILQMIQSIKPRVQST